MNSTRWRIIFCWSWCWNIKCLLFLYLLIYFFDFFQFTLGVMMSFFRRSEYVSIIMSIRDDLFIVIFNTFKRLNWFQYLVIVNLFWFFNLILLYLIFINSLAIHLFVHLFFFFLLLFLLGDYQLLFCLFLINIKYRYLFIQSTFWCNLWLNNLGGHLILMKRRTFLPLGVILYVILIILNHYIYNFGIILFLLLTLYRGSFLINWVFLLKVLARFHWIISLSF